MTEQNRPPLLVVDDEEGVRTSLSVLFEPIYQVLLAASGEEALKILTERDVAAVLLDLSMPKMGGLEVLRTIKVSWPSTEVVVVTAVNSVESAVQCMKDGAYDYITKPWDMPELRDIIKRAVEKWQLSRDNQMWHTQQDELAKAPSAILGDSPAMVNLRELISRVAQHDSTALITGESGTGKELAAFSLHAQSPRRTGRFVAISCATIPAELVESELFGHEKGAFSSAVATRIGKFEYAHGGTLFLDDVATLPMNVQAKLLRVLQERVFTRLGSNRLIEVDVRVISCTNQDLKDLVRRGLFREDLYWRLCGVPINIPPLRERGDDVRQLLNVFVLRVCQRVRKPTPKIRPEVYEALKAHPFPGNVRELANLAETLVVLSEGDEIDLTSLPIQLVVEQKDSLSMDAVPIKRAVREFEKHIILRTLKGVRWNQSEAARQLGVHRNTLINKIRECGIKIPD